MTHGSVRRAKISRSWSPFLARLVGKLSTNQCSGRFSGPAVNTLEQVRTGAMAAAMAAPGLLAKTGVGADVAVQRLVTAGDNPERLRSEASFAHHTGTTPIPASSGRTTGHRLNRGDRSANNALHTIAPSA
jgi:transposase